MQREDACLQPRAFDQSLDESVELFRLRSDDGGTFRALRRERFFGEKLAVEADIRDRRFRLMGNVAHKTGNLVALLRQAQRRIGAGLEILRQSALESRKLRLVKIAGVKPSFHSSIEHIVEPIEKRALTPPAPDEYSGAKNQRQRAADPADHGSRPHS